MFPLCKHVSESWKWWHIWMRHGVYEWVMIHVAYQWVVRHDSFIWDMTHSYGTWLIHVRHDTFTHAMSHANKTPQSRPHKSHGTYEWVTTKAMAHLQSHEIYKWAIADMQESESWSTCRSHGTWDQNTSIQAVREQASELKACLTYKETALCLLHMRTDICGMSYKWAMAHTNEFKHEWVIVHQTHTRRPPFACSTCILISMGCHINESWHVRMSRSKYKWVMALANES